MAKTETGFCQVCIALFNETSKFRPRTSRYITYVPWAFGESREQQYGGLPTEGSQSGLETRAMYVRHKGAYRRVGEICPAGHVTLSEEWAELPDTKPVPEQAHVVSWTNPRTVICRATGEAFRIGDSEQDPYQDGE